MVDTTPPWPLRGVLGAKPLTLDQVRSLAAWHKRHKRGDVGWGDHGGAIGRDWAKGVLAEFALDPGQVHVPTAVDDDGTADAVEYVSAKAMSYEEAPFVDQAWDASAAVGRLRKWAGVDGEEPSASAWAKYAKGFAIVDGDGNKFGDFHYPHHDIVDGKFVTIPKGVTAAIGALNGARGGGKGLSDSEKAAALAHLEKHRDAWEKEKAKESRSLRDVLLLLPKIQVRAAQMRTFDASVDVRSSADYVPVSISVIQIACIGKYKGHNQGEFEFTVETFDEIIRNFEASKNRRVPIDHEHSSESPQGAFVNGAPAVGWCVALENRGEEGLWGTIEWVDEVVVERIRSGKTMYFSPAVWFDAVHPETAEHIGAMLVSGGTTNRPFLDGMQPLAASARRDGRSVIALHGSDHDEEAERLEHLRAIFRLPELAPADDVMAELDRLEHLLASVEPGIDVEAIIESLRWMMGLPALTSAADVIAEVRKGLPASVNAPTESSATEKAAEHSARLRDGHNQESTMPGEKSAEHKAIEGDHERLMREHAELVKAHEKLTDDMKALRAQHAEHLKAKAAIAKHMGLEPESEWEKIVESVAAKAAAHDRLQKEEAAHEAKMIAEEVDHVAAAASKVFGIVYDEAAKAAMLDARKTNKSAFRVQWTPVLKRANELAARATEEVRRLPAARGDDEAQQLAARRAMGNAHDEEAWKLLLSGRVAPQGAAPHGTTRAVELSAVDEFDACVADLHTRMMREHPEMDPITVLNLANTEARRQLGRPRGS